MRRKGRSPTQRTLAELRARGMIADVVERRSPPRPGLPWGQTHDYLGCVDIIAFDPTVTLAVQSCGSAFAEHWRKITEDCAHEVREWLRGPSRRMELWGWRKVKKVRGGKAMVWAPRVREVTLEDVDLVEAAETKTGGLFDE